MDKGRAGLLVSSSALDDLERRFKKLAYQIVSNSQSHSMCKASIYMYLVINQSRRIYLHVIGLCPSKFVEKTSTATVIKGRKKNS